MIAGAACLQLARAFDAHARDHASARLDFVTESGTTCGDAEELRAAVAGRLGYDPFVDRTDVPTVVVRIRAVAPSALEASIERREASGARGRPSTITSKRGDCAELLNTVAVGAAIAVDPLSLQDPPAVDPSLPALPPVTTSPPAPPSPAASSPAPPPAGTQAEAAPVPASTSPASLLVGVGGSVATGALPVASFGPRLLVGVHHGAFELDLEARYDAPVRFYQGAPYVEASLALANLAPCLRWRWLISCGELALGALFGKGAGYAETRKDNTFYAAAGVREAVEISFAGRFAARISLEGLFALRPTRLEANGQTLWTTPLFAFSVVPTLLGRFP